MSERPSVAVVGAGLAGLACADRLARSADVVVLEARDRAGGRCWSSHGWADGQVAEHGGELIEVGQDHVLALVDDLGLELESRQPDVPAPGLATLGGRTVDLDQLDGLVAVIGTLAGELDGLPGVTLDLADDAARRLDEMTVRDWLDDRLDGGSGSTLGLALSVMVALNLGFDPAALSALSLHHMLVGLPEPGQTQAFAFGNELAGESDDSGDDPSLGDVTRAAVTHTFHVRGGNDLIAAGLADRLPPGGLRLQSAVTGIRRDRDGTYVVTANGSASPIRVQRVVLTNPLPTLRAVDLTDAGLSPRRHDAINGIDMGTGTKIMLQLSRRPEEVGSWPGFAISDRPAVAAWDTSVGQHGVAGIVTLFGQGPLPSTVEGGHGALAGPARDHALQVMRDISPDLPALVGQRGWVDVWADDPWAIGSYSGYGPGQYTRFSGFLAQPEDGIHFAGEHTSLASPGYLDGAIASGYRAAAEVLASLGLPG